MKHLLIVACAVLLATMQAGAATMRDFLISEPGVVFPTLPQAARAGLVTYAEQGQASTLSTTNRFGNSSSIDTLTADYAVVKVSQSCTISLKMLTRGTRDTVIAVIETVATPTRDSRIAFYDTQWKPLPTRKYFKQLPAMRDFFKPATPKDTLAQLLTAVDFPMIEMQWTGPGFNTLTATQGLKTFYSKEDYQKWAPYVVDSIDYYIDGGTAIKRKTSKR